MSEWHPVGNAQPVFWLLRNGRWAEPYAVVRSVDVRVNTLWEVRFQLRAWRARPADPLGEFPTLEAASVFAWNWYLEQSRADHRKAATRQGE